MTSVVASAREALENIARFPNEVSGNGELRDRLPFARAWYAVRSDDGGWQFGPSKFIGYRGLSAADYIKESQELDGRRTERQLTQWFVTVGPQDPLYDELNEALGDFLEGFGKAPSNLARINILRDEAEQDEAIDRAIVDLMITVSRRLPPSERSRLRSAL